MALSRLKLAADRSIVYLDDGALDKNASDFRVLWEEYQKSYDPSLLPILEGETFTIFRVGSLTVAQAARVESLGYTTGEAITEALAYGIHAVEHLRLYDPATAACEAVHLGEAERKETPLGRRLTDEAMGWFADTELRVYLYAEIRKATKLQRPFRASH